MIVTHRPTTRRARRRPRSFGLAQDDSSFGGATGYGFFSPQAGPVSLAVPAPAAGASPSSDDLTNPFTLANSYGFLAPAEGTISVSSSPPASVIEQPSSGQQTSYGFLSPGGGLTIPAAPPASPAAYTPGQISPYSGTTPSSSGSSWVWWVVGGGIGLVLLIAIIKK
jgi:hypothetical protein